MLRAFAAATLALCVFLGAPVRAAELIMVEEPGCAWCAKWERELGAIYPKTPEGQFAPLRKVQLHDLRKSDAVSRHGFTLVRPAMFTPTFVLIEDGKELSRLEGYPGEDFFWGLLKQMLVDQTDYTPPEN
ncbi:thioredoxin family protein [uncultured Aliiroseovarius sp.]|uniref:thioredoxin family protein n=1 Tax=uncultured Aliiroseovarius sp. TaxID=1658783 RepID=UPI00260887AE|nr:thioredoxin family protein [uncultured Aliiroseovarius sp.]